MSREKVPPRKMTQAEIQAEREEYKVFVHEWQKRTKENLSHANTAWRAHLIAKYKATKNAKRDKLRALRSNPAFQKYLRGD